MMLDCCKNATTLSEYETLMTDEFVKSSCTVLNALLELVWDVTGSLVVVAAGFCTLELVCGIGLVGEKSGGGGSCGAMAGGGGGRNVGGNGKDTFSGLLCCCWAALVVD